MSSKYSTKASPKPLKSHYNVSKLLLIGLAFHLIYINSVFDCYFTSPVVHGMKSYGIKGEDEAPAKRLVLIVGDGLRADLLFSVNAFPNVPNSLEVVSPHLRSIVETRGAFGISHTRVPTESRPGHVAIIGGMYEDVSAVTKGWKTNPVDFDSVFNRSRSTYSFGSPDILPMFAKGASPPGKVKTWMYDEDEEDFTKDATALDIWVLDHLKQLFKNATTDPDLDKDLRSDKVVFFLHLLGLDTTGHAYRPHSTEYMNNIQVVDNIVQETEKLLKEFYHGDEKTAFVFTADHGMSVIGNHGDGHPDNTRTPLIAWGSGVRKPLPETPSMPTHDAYSHPWNLTHLLRTDVEQADIAALMAALLGVGWPVNGVGVLPDVKRARGGYLDREKIGGEKGVAELGLTNAKVILEQYSVKDELKRKHTLFYKPFKPLASSISDASATTYTTDTHPLIIHISSLISSQSYTAARQASFELIQLSLQGLHYLQTYDRFLIRGLVAFAYLGWAAWSSLYLFRPLNGLPGASSQVSSELVVVTRSITWVSWVVLGAFWTVFAVQRSPWSFYVYVLFPTYFWREVARQTCVALTLKDKEVKSKPGMPIWKVLLTVLVVVGALLGMVAGYTHRSIWSMGFLLIGLLWPLSWTAESRVKHTWTLLPWAASCLMTAVFPLLSVDKTENLGMVMLGGLCFLLAGSIAAWYALQDVRDDQSRKTLVKLFSFQALAICATMFVTASSVRHLQAKQGLPLLNQIAGWVVLVISSVLPFAFKTQAHVHTKYTKILMYFLGFGPCFVILSISVEGSFFLSYSAVLVAWVQVEKAIRSNKSSSRSSTSANSRSSAGLQPSSSGFIAYQLVETEIKLKSELEHSMEHKFERDDLRIALFFLFFVQVGFFGTGNVASISSFYLAPVYRLIPIFNPFYMSALLIFKIIAPYVMLSVTFAVLNDALNLPPFSLLLVALTITDGMTLTFFYKVQDTGSWLEIGQSISFFCITSLLLLWAAGICAAGEWLMADVLSAGKAQYVKEKGKKVQ